MAAARSTFIAAVLLLAFFARIGAADDTFGVAKQFVTSVQNVAAGDPSALWTSESRRRPLPTNKYWQNFVLNSGTAPEYIHPYSIQSKNSSISISYPKRIANANSVAQIRNDDLVVGNSGSSDYNPSVSSTHVVERYDDLSITLRVAGMRIPLLRGSPYITLMFDRQGVPTFSTNHTIVNTTSTMLGGGDSKHMLFMDNLQKWIVYASPAMALETVPNTGHLRANAPFQGVLRVAALDPSNNVAEPLLDKFRGRIPVGGRAIYETSSRSPSITYKFSAQGDGELLMLGLPMHRRLLQRAKAVPEVRFASMDGQLQGVVGETWTLRAPRPSIGSWQSSSGIAPAGKAAIAAALEKDVSGLQSINLSSTYFFGKAAARAARLAVIAEEVGRDDLRRTAVAFVKQSLSPWFDGSANGNAIVYDSKWGGLVSQAGAFDSGADFGLGVYNDHHYHWGYFLYAGAVLARMDTDWGSKYRTNLYSLAGDYVSPGDSANFPRFRNFDPWVLHSWAGGLTEFGDGRNQESTSEAVNAYYAAKLLGDAYGDDSLSGMGNLLAVFEAYGAESLWHVPQSHELIYEREFSDANRITGILWANKRDSNLWFSCGTSATLECRLGIQVIPVTPATEVLFQDREYNRQLFQWASPTLATDPWKAFAFAVQATYDPQNAHSNVQALQSFDDGNSMSNMLWWVYTRSSTSTSTSTTTTTTTTATTPQNTTTT